MSSLIDGDCLRINLCIEDNPLKVSLTSVELCYYLERLSSLIKHASRVVVLRRLRDLEDEQQNNYSKEEAIDVQRDPFRPYSVVDCLEDHHTSISTVLQSSAPILILSWEELVHISGSYAYSTSSTQANDQVEGDRQVDASREENNNISQSLNDKGSEICPLSTVRVGQGRNNSTADRKSSKED